ncbi:GNAT family N-acetyltransferase [Mucilaginibacter paludis]|uniref:GCN5-related N-acetyltransferase n=1 Tax=Mucilaginibacter paludis DSM 18603 TaxID=714943 RepID=H1YFP6_9SPHI|nr:GNAT family N-acetyltransferase [Mucilaginibacter paludis]EHQ24448.1 GCN5-related N-acetyltransferase [Mucilaginibacter paludis DSM 18603]
MVIMNDDFFIKKGYLISTDNNLLDFDVIFNYLDKESYWSKGIQLDVLRKAIDNALCFGVYYQQKQIGFAKVVTDKATFAYLADVFIIEQYRGLGLSKWLIQTIKQHEDLQGLRRWMLATADAHGLYAQFGFTPITRAERWMEIFSPYTVNN